MGRRVLLTAVLSILLATMPVSPALAQLAADVPPAPEYEVKDNGNLVIGGDIVVSCSQVGLDEQYLTADGPEARACEAAGFGTAAGPSSGGASTPAASASALPQTGGSGGYVAALVPLALLVGGGLLTFGVVRRDS
jgi:LPXTG-motif cell wall-anchored protein